MKTNPNPDSHPHPRKTMNNIEEYREYLRSTKWANATNGFSTDQDRTARYIARRDAYEERQYEQPAPALPEYHASRATWKEWLQALVYWPKTLLP